MSPDYVCEHRRNGLPFKQSSTPHVSVCPICNPELIA